MGGFKNFLAGISSLFLSPQKIRKENRNKAFI